MLSFNKLNHYCIIRNNKNLVILCFFALVILTLFVQNKLYAQEEEGHLHFSHPLTTESISPDTKVRFDYLYTNMGDQAHSHELGIELEYSPNPAFSIRLETPYVILHPAGNTNISHFDNIELALKFANFAFANHDVLLGYGINFGLPTGSTTDDIGSDHLYSIEPFLNGGYQKGRWEWVGFFTFGIPTNQQNHENVDTEFNARFAAIYHITPHWQGVLEAGRGAELSGPDPQSQNWDYTLGVKYHPVVDKPWIFAIGFRGPMGENDELQAQAIFSVFYHFPD